MSAQFSLDRNTQGNLVLTAVENGRTYVLKDTMSSIDNAEYEFDKWSAWVQEGNTIASAARTNRYNRMTAWKAV